MARARPRPGAKDFQRLPSQERAITFYAEDGASWPHFEPIIAELTGPLGRTVSYLTSDAADPIFDAAVPGLRAFHIGEGFKRAYLFQKLEVGVLVATVPQLGIKVLPRSRRAAELGTRYVYVFHSMASTHMIYEPDGFDHYDTVLTVGPYMTEEIRRREAKFGLPAKELVDHGYGRLDAIIAAAGERPARSRNDPPVVLIAPSWGPTCLFETCGDELVRILLDAGYEVIARPHPMTAKRTPGAIPALVDTFGSHPRFTLDSGIAAQDSLHRSDLMVSDWSGAALEYAFGLERPVLFVDVPRKVNNADYEVLGIEPFEVTVRDQIGRVVDPGALAQAPALIDEMIEANQSFTEGIRDARERNIFNVGTSGAVAAAVIAEHAAPFATAGSATGPRGGQTATRGDSTQPAAAGATPATTRKKPRRRRRLSRDHDELFAELAEMQPAEPPTTPISVPRLVKGWLDAGPRVFEGDDRDRLEALCRQIDVRRKVSVGYQEGWKKLDPETPADPSVVSGLIAVLLANAGHVGQPGPHDSLNDGWGLKCTNSALKALELGDDLPGDPTLRAWALEILDQARTEAGSTDEP